MTQPEMTAEAAVSIIKLLEQNGIEVYVDGGWGVDALLDQQTREARRPRHRPTPQICAQITRAS